jgi:hypothetical protein
MLAVLAFVAASSMNGGPEMRDIGLRMPLGEAAAVTIDAMPFTRTVTCSTYTLTGTASGGSGAVSWSASPSGASGACTGTTSWSCVVDVDPDAVGEGVEVITVARSGATSDTETIGFYVDGEHSCFLAQSINGTYNSGLVNADPVATWENLGSSALDVTQGTGSAQPSYRTAVVGGQPVVRCDGGDRVAASTAADWIFLANGTDVTAEVIEKSSSANATFISTSSNDNTTLQKFLFWRIGAQLQSVLTGASLAVAATSGSVLSTTQFELLGSVLDDDGGAGVDLTVYRNGSSAATGTTGAAYATSASSALTVCATANGTFPITGDLFRVLIYQSALSATQRGINKAVDEWALGGTLPVTP